MKIYHGSDSILKKPLFGKSKEDNDYGSGFYTTEIREEADEWALINGSETSAICNCYEINIDRLNVLHLRNCGALAWIAEIVTHKGARDEASEILGQKIADMYKVNTDHIDIIIGYSADDSYIDIVDAFLKNEVSLNEVENFLEKGKLREQVFIKSQRAFEMLVFIGCYDVTRKCFFNEREAKARKEVSEFLQNRNIQIRVEGYVPLGITAREAVRKRRRDGYDI